MRSLFYLNGNFSNFSYPNKKKKVVWFMKAAVHLTIYLICTSKCHSYNLVILQLAIITLQGLAILAIFFEMVNACFIAIGIAS